MKAIFIIYFYVALFVTIIPAGVRGGSLADVITKMANQNQSIDRIFKPSKNGLLGAGWCGFSYRGILLLNGMEVAMKFTNQEADAKNEYKIYSYLNAINNESSQAYGIPTIYYFGTWKKHYMLAMTLLDVESRKIFEDGNFTKIDLLIKIREFVRISKYIHSRGVFHADLKFVHIMFRKYQGFVYDFNLAEDGSKWNHRNKLKAAQNDWKAFFNTMYLQMIPKMHWFEFSEMYGENIRKLRTSCFAFTAKLFEDSTDFSKLSGLRKVFAELVSYANETPSYDQLYQTIVEIIQNYEEQEQQPAVLSWLTTEQDKRDAIAATPNIPPISSIGNPFELDGLQREAVNYEFFSEFYRDQL